MSTLDHVYSAPREWTRVHRASPLLGGWAVLAGVAGYWFYTTQPGQAAGDGARQLHISILLVAAAAVAGALIAIGFGYLGWYFHTFRITDEALEQRRGVVFRQQRQARLDRLQAVDVVQPLMGRLFGFAKITVEVAGGARSGIELQFLRLADAEALRNEILALAAGYRAEVAAGRDGAEPPTRSGGLRAELEQFRLAPAPGSARTAVAAAEERPLVAVPVPRLLLSILLSGGTIASVAMVLIFVGGSVVVAILVPGVDIVGAFLGGGFLGLLSGAAGMVSVLLASLNRGVNFRLGISSDGVRIAHGLLETRKQTVPPGRVQAVHFKQSLLWRRRDWWEIVVNVAGYQDNQQAVSTLLPVGTREDALAALWSVLPDLGDPDPQGTVSLALSGSGADGGFVTSPASATWVDPLQRRFRGVRATETALFIRRGWLVKELIVVPHERTQSLALRQGPIQRALGLADVAVHSTKGAVRPVAQHLAVADAVALLTSQARRARARRKVQTPEQWMEKVGLLDDGAE
ncbi:PH domain-containing protein [Demequina sp.]|uniref:PH domain-containing protein n=1 Tax=Demequina sp. TaxID=2050685 RepID=UPI0025BAA050|nr:PH domain-containing protein [Demequina sp.]